MNGHRIHSWSMATVLAATMIANPGCQSAPPVKWLPPSVHGPRIMVYQIEIPVGGISGNLEFWKELNESGVDPASTSLLAQNGMRAGVGRVEVWPKISHLIDPRGAFYTPTLVQYEQQPSVNIWTRQGIQQQTADITVNDKIEHKVLDQCDNGFRVSIAAIPNKSSLDLKLIPIVALGASQATKPSSDTKSRDLTVEELFPDLQISGLTFESDQFILISPAEPKTKNHSVGTQWLSSKGDQEDMETVLVLVRDK